MRVALDATYSIDPHPSGIAVYSRELLSGLAGAHPRDSFLHCYRLKKLRGATKPAYQNVGRRLLQPPLTTFHADLFHALNQRVDTRSAPVVISTFHDLFVLTGEYSSPEFRARFSRQAQSAAQRSDWIIAVSEFTARQVTEHLGFDRNRVQVIPHGVRLPQLSPSRQREKIVLFVGALQIRKNVERLIEAFETLSDEWRLILAGAPNGYGAEGIQHRIERSTCRKRIKMTGYVDAAALEDLYARATIFAFPSLAEGFGIPVLEAMAHGLAVVTSNTSALPEVAGDAAILVDPLRTDEIAGALSVLVDNEHLRNELVRKGLDRAHQFPWEKAVAKTFAVYEKALQEVR